MVINQVKFQVLIKKIKRKGMNTLKKSKESIVKGA